MAKFTTTNGYVALIDDVDYDAVISAGTWRGVIDRYTVYVFRRYQRADGSRKRQTLHGFLTGFHQTDHINGNGLDNRRANLRPATNSQNQANARIPRSNKSGFKGVWLHRPTGRFWAYIKVNRIRRHLGCFATAEEAAQAYDVAAIEAWGEYARPNLLGGDVRMLTHTEAKAAVGNDSAVI